MTVGETISLEATLQSPKGRAVRMLRGLINGSGIRQGDRLPAESKLAHEFGVSRVTLRSALAVLEREGVVRRERNVGCILARSGKPASSLMARTIVLVTDLRAALNGQVFGGSSDALVSGVIDSSGRQGLDFLCVSSFDEQDNQWLEELISARPRGVILSCWIGSIPWQLDLLRQVTAAGLPVVSFGHSSLFDGFDTVRSDHQAGTEQLVHCLAERGKRRILRLWTLPPETAWIQEHNKGYEKAVGALGLPLIPAAHVEAMLERVGEDEGNFRIRARQFAGYLAEHLHCRDPIDAIMVGTDSEALVAVAACRLFGRNDIAVVGYDNYWRTSPERQWEPGMPVATVDKNNHRLGEMMVELLTQRIKGALPPGPQRWLIPQQLIVTN